MSQATGANLRGGTVSHILFAASLGLLAYAALQPVQLAPDSQTYMNGLITRAPLYPLFLAGLKALSPQSHLRLSVVLQCLAGYGGAYFFAAALRRSGLVGLRAGRAVLLFLYAPYVFNGAAILSEPLTYAAYLAFLGFAANVVSRRDIASMAGLLVSSLACVLFRPQFSFIYVAAMAVIAGIYLIDKDKKTLAACVVALIAVTVCAQFGRNAYNKLVHGYFGQVSTMGEHLLANQLYVAKKSDLGRIGDENERAFLARALDDVEAMGLSFRDNSRELDYAVKLNKIYYDVMYRVYDEVGPKRDSQVQNMVARESFCWALGVKLLRLNLIESAKALVFKLWSSQVMYLVVITMFLFTCLWRFVADRSGTFLFDFVTSLCVVLNYATIILFTSVSPRYTYVCDVPMLAVFCISGLSSLTMTGDARGGRQNQA